MVLFSPLMTFTEKMLDVTTIRHRVIANNLANVNSPGFKRSEVSFEEALQKIREYEEDAPETQTAKGSGVDAQLLQNLSLEKLHYNGQHFGGDLGVNFAIAEATFHHNSEKHPAAGVELDPRAPGAKGMSRSDLIAAVQPEVVDTDGTQRMDGNNVSPELEVAKMIKNTSFYNVLVSSISGEFRTLKTIISNR